MLKTWIERLTKREPKPVRVEAPWTRTEPAPRSRTVKVRPELAHTLPSGPRLEGSILEPPPPSAVPADLVLMNELAAAEREARELAELERWIAEEDVRSERLRREELAVLGLLRRSG